MNRSDFLAMIPALGFLPIIFKDKVQEGKNIVLIEPKPIEIVKEMPRMDFGHVSPDRCQFLLVIDNVVVGSTNATMRYGMSEGLVEGADLEHYSDRYINPRLRIEASFSHEKVIEAYFAMSNANRR